MQNSFKNKKVVFSCNEKFDVHINSFLQAEHNHIFNEPSYFKLHSVSRNDCYAQLVRRIDNKVFGTMAFHEIDDGKYSSPRRGTFGGLSINSAVGLSAIEKFIEDVTNYLRDQGGREIRVKLAPASHDSALFATSFNCLARLGYLTERTELNYDMLINDSGFLGRIAYGNKKRIRKAAGEGFVCKNESLSSLPKIHQLIAENRMRLGVSISMSIDELYRMNASFPERLHLFGVYRDDTYQDLVASAVCLEISESILYVLYWGDTDSTREYSPVATLASWIYDFAAREGFRLLDVGTSTVSGEPNHGLVNFKRNLGFLESLKVEMMWRRV